MSLGDKEPLDLQTDSENTETVQTAEQIEPETRETVQDGSFGDEKTDALNQSERKEEENAAAEHSADEKPEEEAAAEKENLLTKDPKEYAENAEAKPKTAEKKQQSMTGKHGRPLKTDPYGNPIRKKKKDAPLRKPDPEQTVTPADIQKPQVSFLNSIANIEPASRSRWTGTTSQAYDHAVMRDEGESDGQYSPKIRRMSDSTRAKEIRKRRRAADAIPYQKETPVESPLSLPASKLKKRKKDRDADEMERIPTRLQARKRTVPEKKESDGDLIRVRAEHTHAVQPKTSVKEKDYSKPETRAALHRDLLELKNTLMKRAVVLAVLTVICGLITYLDWLPGFPMPHYLSSAESPVSYLIFMILLGLFAIPFSFDVLKNGYMKLMYLRADSDSLASVTMLSALLSAILVLPSPEMLKSGLVSVHIGVGLFSLLINAISKNMIVARALRNFQLFSDGNEKYAIRYVEDEKRAENLARGTLGDFPILATMQRVEQPGDFLKYTFSTDIGDKFCRTVVPLVFVLSAAFSVMMSSIHSEEVESAICYGVSIFALCFSACACTAITLIANLPMASGTKAYVKNSGMLLGFQSVDDFYDVNCVMVDARTLFPKGTTKLESIQMVGESRIEEALQYSASLTQHAGSILKDLFTGAILAEDRLILPVEDYAYDEGRGISGWIHNKRILLGTREMMIEHNIEGLPVSAKEEELVAGGNEALYLSVSGTVSAMYVVHLEANKTICRWLEELERENLFLLVRSNDALLSQRSVAKMFGFPEDLLKVMPARLEADYEAETKPVQTAKPSMICAGRLPGFIQTIVGAKRIRSAATLGLILQTVTACIGLLYVLVFILMGSYSEISGAFLLMYHLACTIITAFSVRLREK